MGKFIPGYNRLPDGRSVWMIQASEEAGWNWEEFFNEVDPMDARRWGGPDWVKSTSSRKRIREEFQRGDLVFCYQADPLRAVVGLTRIAQGGLSTDNAYIYFKKWRMLIDKIALDKIKRDSILCDMEKARVGQGTVFRVSEAEARQLLALSSFTKKQQAELQREWQFPDENDYANAPTADSGELDARVRQLLSRGTVPRPTGNATPERLEVKQSTVFKRAPQVKAFVLQEASGRCELCSQDAPFRGQDNEPFLEVHHVVRLIDGGPDTVDNVAAVCPNCHRALHLALDSTSRTKKLYKAVRRLKRPSDSSH